MNKIIEIIRVYMKENFKDFPKDCCYLSSILFVELMKDLNINANIYYGKYDEIYHFWNKIDNIWIDITIDQFDKNMQYGIIDNTYYLKHYKGEIDDLSWLNEIDEDTNYFNNHINNCKHMLQSKN